MATAERTTASDSSTVYDGFISYSHAADDLLAPRLQSGLQRFAKPWWKRRALRIFRDESSLSANPHLWSSITGALDQSGWFVLLLSTDAARSEWVNQEIEYWKQHKEPSRILPVLTDGTFEWTDGNITGTAVPEQLQGSFAEEPRWVDMRFARDETDLDLKDPRFADAVADIASAVRGVPKDDLASEEVKQHRRTIRTAWAAGVLVLLLGAAAGFAAIQASQNAEDARRLADAEAAARVEADDNARRAEAEATRANQEAERAEANAEAETEARVLAQARELGASAINVLQDDPELATLLSLEAIHLTPSGVEQPVEFVNALWNAVLEDRLTRVIRAAPSGPVGIALSSDGTLLAASSIEQNTLRVYSTSDFSEVWSYTETTTDGFGLPFFSPNGEMVAVSIWDSAGTPARAVVERPPDELPARIVFLDSDDGSLLQALEYPECNGARAFGWSPQGSYFAVSYMDNDAPCLRAGVGEDSGWVEILDGATFDQIALIPVLERFGPIPSFDNSEDLYVHGVEDIQRRGLEIYEAPGFERARFFDEVAGWGTISPDGSTAAVLSGALKIIDVTTGQSIDRLTPQPSWPGGFYGGPGFSADGSLVFMADVETKTPIWDLPTGEREFYLGGGPATNAVISPDGDVFYSGHVDGAVRIWSLKPEGGLVAADDLGPYEWVNANMFAVGEDVGAAVVIDIPGLDFRMAFFDPMTGVIQGEPIPAWTTPAIPLADHGFAIRKLSGEWIVYDPITGSETYFAGCPTDEDGRVCTDTGDPAPAVTVLGSVDGTELAVSNEDSPFTLVDPHSGSMIGPLTPESGLEIDVIHRDWLLGFEGESVELVAIDRASGEELARITDPGFQRLEVSATGRLIAMTSLEGLTIVDTERWQESFVELNLGNVRGIAISQDAAKVALGDENGLHIVDVGSASLEQSVPLPSISDIHWLDDGIVLVGGTDGLWATIPLGENDLVAVATDNLTRSFTQQECETYRISPCPTLDEIRSR